MKNLFLILVFIIFCIGCQQKQIGEKTPKTWNEKITGEWILDTVMINPRMDEKYSFKFSSDSILDYSGGFYLQVEPNRSDRKTHARVFMGTKSKYMIDGDSLKLFDQNHDRFMSFKIASIDKDQMTLWGDSYYSGSENVKFIFKRKKTTIPEHEKYDAIIVTRSACFGACPINGTYIDKNGNYFFNGVMFNTRNEFFKSKGNAAVFKDFESRFNHARITSLKTDYFGSGTDGATNEVTFIKNGKIVKTISDYLYISPVDFRQAYNALSFKYQSITLDYVPDEKFDHNINFSRFENDKEMFVMSDAETFYFYVLLYNSKPSETPFKSKYRLEYFVWENQNDTIKKIETDGRYYRFIMKNGTKKQYDIGYDFIERNKDQLKPRN